MAYVILEAASYLGEWGFLIVEQCDEERPGQSMLPEKLSAYGTGLGVYARSGLILHPELGNRIVIGAFLTDVRLEPDGKLLGFDPCRGSARIRKEPGTRSRKMGPRAYDE